MSLLDTVKSLLGLEDDKSQPRRGGDVAVTVEHDPDGDATPASDTTPATETEDAVKGTDTASGTESTGPTTDATASDAATAAADASESGDTTETADAAEPADEPAESAADEPAESAADEPVTPTDESASAGEPLDGIKGIGPAYAERLADAGVGSVAELADADPNALADETGLSEKRLTRWVERAKHR